MTANEGPTADLRPYRVFGRSPEVTFIVMAESEEEAEHKVLGGQWDRIDNVEVDDVFCAWEDSHE